MADKTPISKLYDFDVIKLSWCKKHEQHWIYNCPDCMGDSYIEEGIEKGRQMERERIIKELTELYVGNKDGLEGLISVIPIYLKALKEGQDV